MVSNKWRERRNAILNYAGMDDMELHDRLKSNDAGAWEYVRNVIMDQEKRSTAHVAKRLDWNTEIDEQLNELYLHMMGNGRKICNYKGDGSLIGWLRCYIRGYLGGAKPNGDISIYDPVPGTESNLEEKLSDGGMGIPYGREDLQIEKDEKWVIAQQCFRNVWRGNGIQAYVMLLKLRFGMSSAEIRERLGISSEANVDQLFSRGVKKMREEKSKYER